MPHLMDGQSHLPTAATRSDPTFTRWSRDLQCSLRMSPKDRLTPWTYLALSLLLPAGAFRPTLLASRNWPASCSMASPRVMQVLQRATPCGCLMSAHWWPVAAEASAIILLHHSSANQQFWLLFSGGIQEGSLGKVAVHNQNGPMINQLITINVLPTPVLYQCLFY